MSRYLIKTKEPWLCEYLVHVMALAGRLDYKISRTDGESFEVQTPISLMHFEPLVRKACCLKASADAGKVIVSEDSPEVVLNSLFAIEEDRGKTVSGFPMISTREMYTIEEIQ